MTTRSEFARELARTRHVHPVAWWVWALGLAVAASRTLNPVLLVLVICVATWVAIERRAGRDLRVLLALLAAGLGIVVVRVILTVIFGSAVTGPTIAVTLPQLPLPDWVGGVRIGGPVSLEALLWSAYEGLQLAAILVCVGAANALAPPTRLLRFIPATLYDVGTSIVVGLTYAPAVLADVIRVRRARALRGHTGAGPTEIGRIVVPVLSGALERSLDLAASMESRGYGRSGIDPRRARRASGVALLGAIGVVAGAYGLVDHSTPWMLSWPLAAGGAAIAAGSLFLGAGTDRRTHYRRDPWSWPESVVTALAALVTAVFVAADLGAWPGLTPEQMPIAFTVPPVAAVVAVLVAGAAGVITPAVPVARPMPRPGALLGARS